MPTSATPYPPPPSFYKLYDPNVSDEKKPTRPNLVQGSYETFGATHHTAPWHDTEHGLLAPGNFVYPICTAEGGKNVDIREEIVKLVQGATERFVATTEDVIDAPTKVEKDIGDLYAIFNNAHKVINEIVRPAQAMETLEHALKGQITQKREAIEALKTATSEAKAAAVKAKKDAGAVDGAVGKMLVDALK